MQRAIHVWASGNLLGLKLIVGLDWVIDGKEYISDGSAVFAVKHQSAWETFVFLTIFDDPQYVLKRELMAIPFWGWYAKKCEMISVDRKAGAKALRWMISECDDRLRKKRQIIVFPEGTRVSPGDKGSYQPGIAALYSKLPLNTPLVPVALNSGLYWGRRSYIKKPGIIRISFLKPINPGLKRKAFLSELESRIEAETDKLIAIAKS